MSTDAWIEEHWIGEAVLLRSRRAPKLPALPVPHAPTCSCGNAALAAHAQSRDSARASWRRPERQAGWPKRRRSTGAKADTTEGDRVQMSWSASRTFTDPDAYHAAIARADGVVTARGNFRADLATIQLDRVLL